MIFMRRLIGEITLDMGPGAWISMAAGLCQGTSVTVGLGGVVGVNVGKRVRVGTLVGVRAIEVCVPAMLAASAVCAITVGKYSGG